MREFKNIWSPILVKDQTWRPKKNEKLVIEIGAGVGLHPIQYAQENNNDFVVAIERTLNKFQKMQRRHKNHHLANLLPIHADATRWICQNIRENEVDKYFILYPNPYPKSCQANKRFHNMPFMQYLIKTLKKKGEIVLATNDLGYYQDAKKSLQEKFSLNLLEDGLWTFLPRTHFEKKYRARGEKCFNIKLIP